MASDGRANTGYSERLAAKLAEKVVELEEANRRLAELYRLEQAARAEAESAHQEIEALYQSAGHAIVITDRDGRMSWVNSAFTHLTGYTSEEAIGQNPRLLKSGKQDLPFYQQLWGAILAGQVWHGEVTDRRKDGSLYVEEMTITPVRDERGEISHFIAVKQDITERKRAEQRLGFLAEASTLLARSPDYETTLQSLARLTVPYLADWCIVDVVDEDQTIRRLAVAHADPSKEEVIRELQRRYPPDPNLSEGVWKVLRTGQPEFYPELPDALLATLARDADHLAILRKLSLQSLLCVPLQARGRALGAMKFALGESGRRYGPAELVLAGDLAHRAALAVDNARLYRDAQEALAELRRTQRQVVQQERLRAIGQMASGIAHDFNNALTQILGFSELLLMRPETLDDKELVTRYLELIRMGAQDAGHVVSRLREFYRPREEGDAFQPVNLHQVVEQAISLTEPRWKGQVQASGATIRVELDLEPVPPIAGNEADLREVLINILFNGVDAMPEGGVITVRTRPEAEAVVLEVSDTGTGMTDEVRAYCLEPFFTTKGERGTGLGLAMVYGIVRRHGGMIDVESEWGKGTTVTVRFPVQTEQQPQGRGQGQGTVGPVRRLRVLVVDDEPVVREVVLAYLAADGHTGEPVSNGREALATFQAGKFDLVVTDRAMPEMGGDQLAIAIKRLAPNVPVILLTGFGDLMNAAEEKPAGIDLIVGKPVTLAALRQAVATILPRALSS